MASAPAAAVAAVVEAGGPHVAELIERVELRLHELAAAHGPRLAAHGEATLAAGGKRLRPLLVFLAAGETADESAVLSAAAAVELVHSATLVHDDVLDRADLRRGHPTVVATAGRAAAIATGDQLFSRAFSELAATGSAASVAALSAACTALAEGELLQRADAWNVEVDVERYLRRCELKTAALFEAACRLGALQGDADADALGFFGRRIGLAFQLLDDVLDMAGPVERTGKRRGTDLLDGTVTLPLILARRRDPALAALDLRAVRDGAAAEALCDAVAATGALEEVRARALEMVAQAKRELPPLPARQRDALLLVADGVVERYS